MCGCTIMEAPQRKRTCQSLGSMSLIGTRINKAKHYLSVLEDSLQVSWNEFYTVSKDHKDWVYRLAAVHPQHYLEHIPAFKAACPIRGLRSMPIDAGAADRGCRCSLIWGYPCHLHRPQLVADHLFPYSFGGPSCGENKIFLCGLHNSVKGSDIHMFPWERGEPAWLPALLERLKHTIGSQGS